MSTARRSVKPASRRWRTSQPPMNPPAPATRTGSVCEILCAIAASSWCRSDEGRFLLEASSEPNDVDCTLVALVREQPPAVDDDETLPVAVEGIKRQIGELRPGGCDHDHVRPREQFIDRGR